MRKKHFIIPTLLSFSLTSIAQTAVPPMNTDDNKIFSHMQVAVTAGTTGIGADVAAKLNKNLRLRAGFNVMPSITVTKDYEMSTSTISSGSMTDDKMTHLCEMLQDFVGAPVDKYIKMDHQLSFYNGRLLVDWYPFKKKNWYFTGGVYIGPKSLGKAFNANTEANTMVAVNMYDKIYNECRTCDQWGPYPEIKIGGQSFELNKSSYDKFIEYGRIAVQLGEFPDGSPHYMTPNEQGVMQAEIEAWVVKPYIGFGWTTNFGYDKRWAFSAEAGAMFLGKTHCYCDGISWKGDTKLEGVRVDLLHDVDHIKGTVGSYINLFKKMPFYPNVEVRLAYTIF